MLTSQRDEQAATCIRDAIVDQRPVYYDVTHLRHNARREVNSGIRRIDFEYASYFFGRRSTTRAMQYGAGGPALLKDNAEIEAIIAKMRAGNPPRDKHEANRPVLDALFDGSRAQPRRTRPGRDVYQDLVSFSRYLAWPSGASLNRVEKNAVYVNVAQHALGYGFFFEWLKSRPDIRSIFFVHDLMPLDYPEFWRRGYQQRFIKGMANLAEVGRAFLVSSDAVKDRLDRELRSRGRPGAPILALPFPAFGDDGAESRPAPVEEPYFVMVGTIEPRKNHLLILNVWRRLAETGSKVPKLVIVGRRGWENEQVVDMLERCAAIRGHVVEAPALSDVDKRRLVANARALLYPSFDEGFGLPLSEALCSGTPVIASDIRVLRETAQDKAIFLDPIDGPGWMAAILDLCDRASPLAVRARALAAAYRPADVTAYFAALERFIGTL